MNHTRVSGVGLRVLPLLLAGALACGRSGTVTPANGGANGGGTGGSNANNSGSGSGMGARGVGWWTAAAPGAGAGAGAGAGSAGGPGSGSSTGGGASSGGTSTGGTSGGGTTTGGASGGGFVPGPGGGNLPVTVPGTVGAPMSPHLPGGGVASNTGLAPGCTPASARSARRSAALAPPARGHRHGHQVRLALSRRPEERLHAPGHDHRVPPGDDERSELLPLPGDLQPELRRQHLRRQLGGRLAPQPRPPLRRSR